MLHCFVVNYPSAKDQWALNLSRSMQIARQHTRFFRQVYDNPKQSDILCGINIRIHIASAILALKRLVVSCPGMLALVASLRSICRWNDNQLDSGKFALVGKELPKLTEIPRIEFCFKGLVSPFGCFANVFQVLNGYAGASLSGFGNNILGNGMVDYHCSGLFSPFKPFQKSGASTLALPCSAFCAFGLNRTTYFSLFFPISVKRVGRIGFTIRSAYNVGYAKIKSDKILNVFDLFFRNFNRLKEEKLAFLENKVSFSFDIRKIVGVVAYKRNTLPFLNSPNRNRIFGIRQYPAVITDAAKFSETPLDLFVKFVGICNFADTAYNHLCRKIKVFTDSGVAMMVYFKLSENLILPYHIGDAVTRSISFLDSIKKKIALRLVWKKFNFQCQFHTINILHSIEKTKSNLVLISKASKAQFLPQTEDLWVSLYQFL